MNRLRVSSTFFIVRSLPNRNRILLRNSPPTLGGVARPFCRPLPGLLHLPAMHVTLRPQGQGHGLFGRSPSSAPFEAEQPATVFANPKSKILGPCEVRTILAGLMSRRFSARASRYWHIGSIRST